jgi:hypothetical protein
MKKWLALVLLGLFVATAIVGCKKKADEEPAPKEKTE